MSGRLIHSILILFCFFTQAAHAQSPGKEQNIRLDSVTVSAVRRSLRVRQREDAVLVDMKFMENMPQILGNADPMHYAQMLPGVQTNNEYQGGIHVQGCDNEHNQITIGGVPVYNAVHLLGFFSTFNATHFPSMSLSESAQQAGFSNRLGGELAMQLPEDVPDRVHAEASAGLISSQGTLRLPIDTHSALTLSLRASYINLLYSRWLRADETQVRYSFYDLNATYVNHLNPHHTILVDAYSGNDHAKLEEEDEMRMVMNERWGNHLGAFHWRYTSGAGLKMQNTLYVTNYHNRLWLDMLQDSYGLSSRITDVGWRNLTSWQGLSGGAEVVRHDIRPQTIKNSTIDAQHQASGRTHSLEMSLHAGYRLPLLRNVSAQLGVRGNLYHADGHTFSSLNPSVKLAYEADDTRLSVSYAMRHQYLFQAGFSDIGLPTEFWFSASHECLPQWAHGFNAKVEQYLWNRRWQVGLSLYYKRLYHQVEYGGTALDVAASDYRMEDQLLHGDGRNYGVGVQLSKCTGRLTGWVSYAYGRARRTYPMDAIGNSYDPKGERRTYPANHDRPHEVNLVATYTMPRHWSFGTTFVGCTGTPFTAPKAVYVMNNNLMSLYSEHNSNRLKSYWRMDVSANYRWKGRRGLEHGLNLSVYNVLCRKNDLFHCMRTQRDGQTYYRAVRFFAPLLPSVSYFIKL